MYDLCTSDLQKRLVGNREAFRLQDEEENRVRKSKKLAEKDESAGKIANTTNTVAPDTSKTEANKVYAPFSFEEDVGSNNSGYYDLIGVLTHKGRSSNSGHYVGWTKNEKVSDDFFL